MRLNFYNEVSIFFNTLLVNLKMCIAPDIVRLPSQHFTKA